MYRSGTTEKLLVQQTPLGELKQTSQKVHCFLQPHIDKATTAPALQLSPAGDQTLGLTPVLVAASFGQTKVGRPMISNTTVPERTFVSY